ncbi:MAG: L-aspartate oxidase [Rhodospirillales bacterium]|nr:L-aspartate oxidase [Rhodospirillales bacterium]
MNRPILIIGAGAAGLITALKLAAAKPTPKIILAVKAPLGEGAASALAQGGVAAAVGADDAPALHAADTLGTAGGLGVSKAINLLTAEAPAAIKTLQKIGVCFDTDDKGNLIVGQEAAHSRRRILHAGGDATGAEIMRALKVAVQATEAIEIIEGAEALDLLVDEGRVYGALLQKGEGVSAVHASQVVLATGGLGALYQYTTNPQEARGDGLAMAARAGARLADMEFVQFHPTAMDIGGDPLPLATEALRGEGATLINSNGVRFMAAAHADTELAPRDVVARAMWRQRQMGQRTYLDCRKAIGSSFVKRFPTVYAYCQSVGIDPAKEPIPVVPAAHYHMGGIDVDEDGRTSLPGLWACGEVASTGIHGANRLASNSLLEAIVFAPRTAEALLDASAEKTPFREVCSAKAHKSRSDRLGIRMRQIAYDAFGLIREEKTMTEALQEILQIEENLPALGGLSNQATVLKMIGISALLRQESRGGHFRSDFPESKESFAKRSFLTLEQANAKIANIDLGPSPYRKKQA